MAKSEKVTANWIFEEFRKCFYYFKSGQFLMTREDFHFSDNIKIKAIYPSDSKLV